MRTFRPALFALLVALVQAACADPSSTGSVELTVENRTDTPLGVYVDDDWVGTDEPGATIVTTLAPTDALSYRIEVRTPSGAVIGAFDAPADAVQDLRDGGGEPLGEEIGVPCGVVRIVIGALGPDASLRVGPAVEPGPCP